MIRCLDPAPHGGETSVGVAPCLQSHHPQVVWSDHHISYHHHWSLNFLLDWKPRNSVPACFFFKIWKNTPDSEKYSKGFKSLKGLQLYVGRLLVPVFGRVEREETFEWKGKFCHLNRFVVVFYCQCLIRSCRRKYSRINLRKYVFQPLIAVKNFWNHYF